MHLDWALKARVAIRCQDKFAVILCSLDMRRETGLDVAVVLWALSFYEATLECKFHDITHLFHQAT